MESAGVRRPRDVDARTLAALTREHLARYRTVTGKPFPQNPLDQVEAAVHGVLESWDAPKAREYRRLHDLPDTLGTAVILQRMVFGNAPVAYPARGLASHAIPRPVKGRHTSSICPTPKAMAS